MKRYWMIMILVFSHGSFSQAFPLVEVELADDEFTVQPLTVDYLDILANDDIPASAMLAEINFMPTTINGVIYGYSATQNKLLFLVRDITLESVSLSYSLKYYDNGVVYSGSADITVSVGVDNVNSPPIAVDDFVSTSQDTGVYIAVLDNDSDADGDELGIVSLSGAVNGSAEIIGSEVLFTPESGFTGLALVNYTINDSDGNTASAVIGIEVVAPMGVNQAPVALDDSVALVPGSSVLLDVLANDTDADGDPLYISNLINAANGVQASIEDEKIRISLNKANTGQASISYRISDGLAESNLANIAIVATIENQSPQANDDSAETEKGRALSIDVLANDTDPDNDIVTLTSILDVSSGTAQIMLGEVLYTPTAEFVGTAVVRYEISDPAGLKSHANLTVTVLDNTLPIAVDDSGTTRVNRTLLIDVLKNDSDADGNVLIVQSVGVPSNGSAAVLDGKIMYVANSDYIGEDQFIYQISDQRGGTAQATITVVILPNTVPVARTDFTNTEVGQALTFDVTANDFDADGDTLRLISLEAATHGGIFEVLDNGVVSFSPQAGFTGTASVNYLIEDDSGAQAQAQFQVRVHEIAEKILSLNVALADEDGIPANRISQVNSNSETDYLSAFNGGDLNDDGVADLVFYMQEGGLINASLQDTLIALWSTPAESLGLNVLLDDFLESAGSIGQGQVLHIDDGKLQETQIQGAADLNNDGFGDTVVLRDFGVLIHFGARPLSPFVNLNTDASYMSAAGTDTPQVLAAQVLDLNGDGIDDLAVAVQGFDVNSGAELKVFFGPIDGSSNLFLMDTPSQTGISVVGFDGGDTVASAPLNLTTGDANGDGVSDLLVGGYSELNTFGERTGQAYLLWGGNGFADNININLANDNGSQVSNLVSVLTWTGAENESIGATLGLSDLNADGIDDVIIGNAYRNAPAPQKTMRAVTTVYGGPQWEVYTDVNTIVTNPQRGSRIVANRLTGTQVRTDIIQSIITADINGDNYGDIFVQSAGKVRALLGTSASKPAIIDIGAVSDQWTVINFDLAGCLARMTTLDINDDTYEDIILFREQSDIQDAFIIYGGIEYR